MITRTFTATDSCGNSTSATQTITVQRRQPTGSQRSCRLHGGHCNQRLMDDATATDNCGEVKALVSSETTAWCLRR